MGDSPEFAGPGTEPPRRRHLDCLDRTRVKSTRPRRPAAPPNRWNPPWHPNLAAASSPSCRSPPRQVPRLTVLCLEPRPSIVSSLSHRSRRTSASGHAAGKPCLLRLAKSLNLSMRSPSE
ncbi:uncharacterized protein LOC125553501 isoform X2 [Triticum urartu]|uniref:uncharacterized protein LOC125553501 isoform X2 n=1 Tax=Triticum urartu TaxID=4572 RepID=UPI002042E505|nr:uncharacterized protein LOC125553501 isoform X2 [Triticum urartu]